MTGRTTLTARASHIMEARGTFGFAGMNKCAERLSGPVKTASDWSIVWLMLSRPVEQIRVEPMTDNPMFSAHLKVSGQGARVDV